MNMAYQNLECIKQMNEADKEVFFELVNHYGKLLDKGNRINNTAFTLHDFSHHCFNIFRIISEVILNPQVAYQEAGLSKEELYILNMSVLFHDISMAQNIHFDRNKHSHQSAQYILEQYQNKQSILYQRGKIQKVQVDAIRYIVQAHSDLKYDNGNVIKTLEEKKLTNHMAGHTGDIRAKLLAGILRLADELDITSLRLGNEDIEDQLDMDNQEERESFSHWTNLHYFKKISRVISEVRMEVDDEYIESNSDNLINITQSIMKIKKKIENEFKYINDHIFQSTENVPTFITLHRFCIVTEYNDLKDMISEEENKNNLIASNARVLEEQHNTYEKKK